MQREREPETKRTAISFLSPPSEPARILPQHALDEGGKRNGLERRVAELLISDRDGTNRPLLGHKRNCASAARAGSRLRTTGRLTIAPLQNFKDWKSAAACDHRSTFWKGRPQPCARQRRCRVPYRARRVRSTTSRWLARG